MIQLPPITFLHFEDIDLAEQWAKHRAAIDPNVMICSFESPLEAALDALMPLTIRDLANPDLEHMTREKLSTIVPDLWLGIMARYRHFPETRFGVNRTEAWHYQRLIFTDAKPSRVSPWVILPPKSMVHIHDNPRGLGTTKSKHVLLSGPANMEKIDAQVAAALDDDPLAELLNPARSAREDPNRV